MGVDAVCNLLIIIGFVPLTNLLLPLAIASHVAQTMSVLHATNSSKGCSVVVKNAVFLRL